MLWDALVDGRNPAQLVDGLSPHHPMICGVPYLQTVGNWCMIFPFTFAVFHTYRQLATGAGFFPFTLSHPYYLIITYPW